MQTHTGVTFWRGHRRFEVVHETKDGQLVYVGLEEGRPVAASARKEIVVSELIRRP